jgi:hypothetical protein
VSVTPCLVAQLQTKHLSQATFVQGAYKFMLSFRVLRFDHLLLLSVHVLRTVHCGCICLPGMLHGVGCLLIMAQHPGGVKI